MSTEAHLHELAQSARQLLGCDQVSLCLSYPNVSVLHPLILLFRIMQPSSPLFYGSTLAPQMLAHEKLWALCDLTGHVGASPCMYPSPDEDCTWHAGARKVTPLRHPLEGTENQDGELPGSAMLVVLERPAGIVGFLLCTARQTDAFKEGERRLLTHYTPYLAELVEQIVSESCLSVPAQPELVHITTEIQEHDTFLSLISHELRAPLMAIKGYVGLLQAYGSGENGPVKMSEEQQRRYLTVTMQQVKHLEVLLGDVLDVSHIRAGHLALRCTKIDIKLLFKRVAQEMQYRVEQQQPGRYHLLCTIDPEIPRVWADADRVQQVLTNLVENAIKYSPSGGLIEIQVCTAAHCTHNCPCRERYLAPVPTHICITVRDQGIGIPCQQQSMLFKPFTRLEHPATKHVSGSGLGLYIACKFVEAMHGRIVLRSREGKGTAITFTLPLASSANMRPRSDWPHPVWEDGGDLMVTSCEKQSGLL